MKKIKLLLFILLWLSIMLFPAATLEKEFQVQPGQQLTVDVKSGGNLEITGWSQHRIKILINFPGKNSEDFQIDMKQSPDGVSLESDYTDRHGRNHAPIFTISVPRSFNLKLKTMGGGINIKNVSGKIGGKTMGGDLTLSQLQGQIDLVTMGGEISFTDSDIDGRVKTMGGRVLLENIVGNIDGSSMGGNVIYRNVKPRGGKAEGKDSVVRISTMGGDLQVEDAPEGAEVKTMGGDIHIRSAQRFINAKTMGGNIQIDAIDGRCTATTMGGDIEVRMTGNSQRNDREVKLTSMGGDISLNMPADASIEIVAEIRISRGHYGDYAITSDFPLQQETSAEMSEEHGDHYQLQLGKGKSGSGKNLVVIKTVNGNISLKKSK